MKKLKDLNFPLNWQNKAEHLIHEKNLQVFELKKDQEEFKDIEKKFKVTMANSVVEKIERIQNKRVWRTYRTEMEGIADKHNMGVETIQIKQLYHGTRQT